MVTLSERLTIYLAKTGMRNWQLAKRVSIGLATINKILDNDEYSQRTAEKIAKHLGEEYEIYTKPRKCKQCGKAFYSKQANKEFCSNPCATKHNLDIKYNRVIVQEYLVEIEEPEESISDTMKAAAHYEVSYGIYLGFKNAGWLHLLNKKSEQIVEKIH